MLAVFAPIWILTVLGYAIRAFGLIDEAGARTIGRFVFYLAMPATLFLALSGTPLSDINGRPLIAFAASTAAVIGAGWIIARQWLKLRTGEQAIWGMSAGYVNSANLGIPIAKQVLGSTSFLVQILLLQVLIVSPAILTALDRSVSGQVRLRQIATMPLRNPVILGSALGVIASATGYRAPGVVHASLALLAAAAVPTALIALGAALHPEPAAEPGSTMLAKPTVPAKSTVLADRAALATPGIADPVRRGAATVGAVATLKLAVHPAIAWAIGAFALHLSRPQLLAVTICAGLPTAQNVFIFAQEYRAGAAQASRAVLVTTTFSLATLAVIAWALGR